MPSELDTHDILFNPLRKRRAEQTARRTADPFRAESTPVHSRSDRDAPATDRAVAYAISELAESDAGPLISSKWIGGVALVAAIVTAAVLMRTPKLEVGVDDEAAAEPSGWWSAAREQWADEQMRVWPIVISAGRSGAQAVKVSKAAATAASTTATPPAAFASTVQAMAPAANPPVAAAPGRTGVSAASDNAYSNAPGTKPLAPAKTSDNPYGDSPAPRARKPATPSTDNPY
jgi:hypothetical protein